ncbi:hypothetical protein FSP39_011224 [Pinctada imbricata]|uniref:C1q domain-containing protein n=1 Tax=Pinctada imbricata TaxID=66713 RepID=A0AA89C2C7_PINIB|nr:hypothetical protein FSP39_011224 [Pinctada imbricata]
MRDKRVPKHNVSFLAYYSKYRVQLGEHEAIKYNRVIENIGNGYNSFTGKFTAPVSGIYSFSVSMMSDSSNYMQLGIMKNRQLLTTLFTNAKTFPQSSNTINVSLQRGDTMWIQRRSGRMLHAHNLDRYNTFSGVLVSLM